MKKKMLNCAITAAVLALTLTGCGGQKSTDAPASSEKTQTAASGETKDSLTIALTNEPTTLDPQLAADSIGGMIILNLHDPLVRRDAEGNVVPGLADSWDVAEDGLSITFHLHEGVKFQDGSALTAEDVAFSLNRAIDKPQSELYTSFMDSAEVVDENTVKVNLKYKELAALQYLTQTNSAIVSKAYVESVGDENYAAKPSGSGPYKLVEWQKGSKIILESNEDYYKGAPAIKHIELRVLKEATTAMVALESGDVDLVHNIGGLDVMTVQSNDKLGYQGTNGTSIWNLAFNVNAEPFNDVKVRKALAMSVKRDDIIAGAMDGAGMPAEIILTDQTTPNPGADTIDTPKYDPEGAKALLAEAGYPNGFKTTISVREDYTKKIASIVQSEWKEIGVDAEIQVMERAALLSDIKAGKLGCYTVGNVSMTLDSTFLLGTLSTDNIPDSNMTFYSNPEYDKLVEQQANTDDPDQRLDLIRQALDIEAEDVPRINLFYMVSNIAYNKDLNCKVCPWKATTGLNFPGIKQKPGMVSATILDLLSDACIPLRSMGIFFCAGWTPAAFCREG